MKNFAFDIKKWQKSVVDKIMKLVKLAGKNDFWWVESGADVT